MGWQVGTWAGVAVFALSAIVGSISLTVYRRTHYENLLAGVIGFTSLALFLLVGVLLAAGVPQAVFGGDLELEKTDDVWKVTQSVTLVFGALAVVGASVITYRRQRTQEQQVETAQEQMKTAHKQFKLDRRKFNAGQSREEELGRQSRYAQGAQMLADESPAVRIAGLVVIAALGREVPVRHELRQTCIDLICAYLKAASAWKDASGQDEISRRYELVAAEAFRLIPSMLEKVSNSPSFEARGLGLDLRGTAISDLNLDDCLIGSARFDGALFSGQTSLRRTRFLSDVSFNESVFECRVILRGTQFLGDAEFRRAEFRSNAVFSSAHFQRTAQFTAATFSSISSASMFNDVVFRGDAEFTQAEFKSIATFDGAFFCRRALFAGARFLNRSSFRGARFPMHPTGIKSPELSRAVFMPTDIPFGEADFEGGEEYTN